MTAAELARHDGRDGRAAYVAVSGTIYDVSASTLWKEGNHEGAHQAGEDLTEALKTAPHVRAVIERFPVVGRLETETPPSSPRKSMVPLMLGAFLLLIIIIVALLFKS